MPEIFNFSEMDEDGPHYPLRVNWGRELQEFDPVRRPGAISEAQLEAAFGEFCDRATLLLGQKTR